MVANKLAAFSQRIHQNPVFEWTTVSIILLSSMGVGLKSYDLPLTVNAVIEVLDFLVTCYFLTEIAIRMAAAGSLRRFFGDKWNVFDFVIVVGSLVPVSESEYALLARLLRVFRVLRLIYVVPELRVLISALLLVLPRLSYVALMMFIIFYIYGAVGNLLFGKINDTLWGDIGIAMLTLFRVATFEDWTDVMYETMEVYPYSWIFYISFIFLSAFVFLNMMIGVIVEALNEESVGYEGEERRAHRLEMETHLLRIEKMVAELAAERRGGEAEVGRAGGGGESGRESGRKEAR